MRIVHNGRVIAEEATVAGTFCGRLIGLIGRRSLPPCSALVIPRCTQVHTFGMRFPIDVLFLNEDNVILAAESLRPWRISKRHPGATKVIELPPGTIAEYSISIGDRLDLTSNE
ncbi:MAG TPA: DUF192 domain-containing protein [Armatimonadota bacterium]|nr:DUF192 domain-containing protein [Armatimonadota bacterium]